jgi:hypothetical protein
MAEPVRPLSATARQKVENALKATIEAELARQKIVFGNGGGNGGGGGGSPFSRGVIFSKSDPFSRGVIFSKSASRVERPDESPILQQTLQMDEAAFHAFADRLIRLKQAKGVIDRG